MQGIGRKLVCRCRSGAVFSLIEDTHTRNLAKTCGCVVKKVGNRVFSGHTCRKFGENSCVGVVLGLYSA